MITAALGLFFVVLTLLAIQVRSGRDPALGPGLVSPAAITKPATGKAGKAQTPGSRLDRHPDLSRASAMSTASPTAAATGEAPSLRTKIAAIAVVVALAALAAYAMFSGPTTVPAPPGRRHQGRTEQGRSRRRGGVPEGEGGGSD